MMKNLGVFLVFNIPLLIMFGVWEWKAALIALGVMLPNIFGNVGGAEKSGWQTHYHCMYFPFMVWAMSLGFIKMNDFLAKRKLSFILYTATAVMSLIIFGIYPWAWEDLKFSRIEWHRSSWVVLTNSTVDYLGNRASYNITKKFRDELRQAVPEGSVVSLPEYMFVPLYQNRKVYYYPLGLDEADYVVVWTNNMQAKPPQYRGIFSYLGEAENIKIDAYLSQRLMEKGYDVYHPTIISNNVAVIKRLNK
jgi:hypothetical protein